MDKILDKWNEILNTVKSEYDISDVSFDTWLRPLEPYGIMDNTLYILVPSEPMALGYISKKYHLPLKTIIAEATGTVFEVKFILPEQASQINPASKVAKPIKIMYQ